MSTGDLGPGLQQLAQRVRDALGSDDLPSFSGLLAPDVHWGPPGAPDVGCRTRAEVVAWWSRARGAGARASVTEVVLGQARLLVGLDVTRPPGAEADGGVAQRWQVLTVRSGQIVDIRGFDDRSAAALEAGVAD